MKGVRFAGRATAFCVDGREDMMKGMISDNLIDPLMVCGFDIYIYCILGHVGVSWLIYSHDMPPRNSERHL